MYVILPNSGQTLGQTRAQIRTNFDLIKSTFDENHYDFDDPLAGKHKFSNYPEQSSDPATDVDETAIYSKAVAGAARLFLREENNGSVVQLSGPTPGGLTLAITPNVGVRAGFNTFLPGGQQFASGFNSGILAGVNYTINTGLNVSGVFSLILQIANTSDSQGTALLKSSTAAANPFTFTFNYTSNTSQASVIYWQMVWH